MPICWTATSIEGKIYWLCLSRKLVLESAERDHVRIPYPGDLSKWAERVYPLLLKKAQEK